MKRYDIVASWWVNFTKLSGLNIALIRRAGKEGATYILSETQPSDLVVGAPLTSTPVRVGDGVSDIWLRCTTGHCVVEAQSVDGLTNYRQADPDNAANLIGGRKRSNIGTRMQFGRFGDFTLNASGNTFEMVAELPTDCLAVQWIFANSMNAGGTTSSPGIVAKTASVADLSDASIDAAMASSLTTTFGGLGAATLSSATAQYRKKYILSDWMPVVSSNKFIGCRVFVSTNANPITISGNGADVFTNWSSRPAGRRIKMRRSNGDNVTTAQGTFSAVATTTSQNPIVGFRYISKRDIVTVCGIGDSITEGRGTYLGEGFILPACEALSSKDCVVEYINLGYSSSPSSAFRGYLADLLAAGIYPDVIVYPNGSPNNVATTITNDHIRSATGYAAAISAVNLTSPRPAVEVTWTWMPSDSTVKAYGNTDALRVAYNIDCLATPRNGLITFDASTLISGVADGTGQVQMVAGSTTDRIHPNDNGNLTILAPALTKTLREALSL